MKNWGIHLKEQIHIAALTSVLVGFHLFWLTNRLEQVTANTPVSFTTLRHVIIIWAVIGDILMVLAAVVFIIIWTRRLMRPVTELTHAMDQIASGNYSTRLSVDSYFHALKNTISTFNKMAEKIENSEKNKLRREQAQKETAEPVLKAEFFANLSHEFRTPLNSIIGFSKALLKKTESSEDRHLKELLSLIYQSGNHLLNLTNNLLDTAKIEAGNMTVYYEKTNISHLVCHVVRMAEPLIGDKDLSLNMEVPDNLADIEVDQTMLKQILINLVSNAIRFTNKGHVTIRVLPEETALTFIVSDTGKGIGRPHLATLLTHLSGNKPPSAGSSSSPGIGIGLSIVKELTQLLHGKAWVESAPGQGTTFYIRIPVSQNK